ncbi:ubiquinol-cytochrome c reductase iron-sulfur subunit [Deinococcus metallilatus]|uniref:Rieske iron-sulfur protein n=1 Tax=Deinococcus metallilatus TaxID=1211322 RepID=A0AAJ5JX53_9DEIO|nr:ubiquinol-cytochrome c reductase iron-sulfur subunit [Deinococcus metallilatus]MBB5297116.1 rieske iron-sulfur protein [Deinococcus metallilatus]QBY07806.1 ubiquinol-cytochrome c reductase iron-sulfur subunit [Deinococcus metallilatus]RXJ13506.1 ubiquinol-cytochrome c reductase iron-sulfur subunit [Deinococcus metallilatus]TLK22337.1 ubiquinol-cytochrome c reductase iron-sulfur subunit [Deinococcus metallilatus]GMA17369.1 cytochrome Complex iron-sulfur subunit [Deinococcus metallilatus]
MTRYKRQDPEITRRKFINVAVGTTAAVGGVSLLSTLGTANPVFILTPDKMPPLKGDILVHAGGDTEGQPVRISELSTKLVRAWPMGKDKQGQSVIRKGDPNNLLVVYRFPQGQLVPPTNIQATIEGQTVAYSDICTHAGCSVGDNDQGPGMKCPCHSGQYDPTHGCIVIGGPPPRKLAQLPIAAQGENIVVTDFFLTMPYPYIHESEWEAFKKTVEEQLT